MFRPGPWEIGLILLIILIIFGAGKLPQVIGSIGKGMREFRKAQRGEYDEEEPKPQKAARRKAVKSRAKK